MDDGLFYNAQAVMLIAWTLSESNRIKRSKLYRAACRMEKNFRKAHKRHLDDILPWNAIRYLGGIELMQTGIGPINDLCGMEKFCHAAETQTCP